jgi:ELWxxDGT repeat protein
MIVRSDRSIRGAIWFGVVLLMLGALPAVSSASGPAHLVKDINADTPELNYPSILSLAVGERLVFTFVGRLWSTDGTAAGTQMLPLPFTSTPYFLGSFNGIGYFEVSDDIRGNELWRTDGTLEGTRLVQDLHPGFAGSWISGLVPFGGDLYFGVAPYLSASPYPTALWRTDGSTGGAVQVADIGPTPFSFLSPTAAMVGNSPGSSGGGDRLFFIGPSSRDPSRPYALYTIDGSGAGPVFARDFSLAGISTVCPGQCPSTPPGALVSMDGIAYFVAGDGAAGLELWRSDGTAAGTALVRDICPGPCGGLAAFEGLEVVGHRLFFLADEPATGHELWTSDGTSEGTHIVRDILKGSGSGAGTGGFSGSRGLAVLGGAVFFPGLDATHGSQLWRSDGTEVGTFPISAIPSPGYSSVSNVVRVGDSIFFQATSNGTQLWRTDSTGSTVTLVAGFPIPPYGLAEAGGAIYFSAASAQGPALWKSDGSPSGTAPLKVLESVASATSSVSHRLGELNGRLFFSAGTRYQPGRLWASDATAEGTAPVADVQVEQINGLPPAAQEFGGSLFFSGSDGHGFQLWRTDGTAGGTRAVSGVPGGFSGPCGMTVFGDSLLFGIRTAPGLWKTDGNSSTLIKDVQVGCVPGSPIVELNGAGFFFGLLSYSDGALWKTNGTTEGTMPVSSGSVRAMTRFRDRLAFVRNEPTGGESIWSTDGTAAGTVRLHVFDEIFGLAAADSSFFFLARGRDGSGLWRSDGTEAGTTVVSSFSRAVNSQLVAVGSLLYFAASDPDHGAELWASDGTAAGTRRLKDLAAGPADSNPRNLTAVDRFLVFSARDGAHGEELWRSDGTEAGTFRLQDVRSGPDSSSPDGFTRAGSHLFFFADDGVNGRELWAMPLLGLDPRPSEREREPRFVPGRQ